MKNLVLLTIVSGLFLLQCNSKNEQVRTDTIQVQHPKQLGVETIPAQRIALGVPDDYKPCIARLPNGELLVVAFHQHKLGTKKVEDQESPIIREDIILFRSQDGGITWSEPETLDILGREPYFTILSDGTILITVHLLMQDVRNEFGSVQTYVHRSTDSGHTWESTRFPGEDFPGWQPGWKIVSSRNILELRDGSLILGMGTQEGHISLFRSHDKGASWQLAEACEFELFESEKGKKTLRYSILEEAKFWEAANGDLLALCRVDPNVFPPLPGTIKRPDGSWDQKDRLVLYHSKDGGKYWSFAEFGSTYGEMYPAIIKLHDGRLLLTFTVRDVHPPLGVRAVLGKETVDGFEFDFEHDRLMIDTKTPIGMPSGGGFGRSVQLDDGTLVTSISYRSEDNKTHLEVIRWKLPD